NQIAAAEPRVAPQRADAVGPPADFGVAEGRELSGVERRKIVPPPLPRPVLRRRPARDSRRRSRWRGGGALWTRPHRSARAGVPPAGTAAAPASRTAPYVVPSSGDSSGLPLRPKVFQPRTRGRQASAGSDSDRIVPTIPARRRTGEAPRLSQNSVPSPDCAA